MRTTTQIFTATAISVFLALYFIPAWGVIYVLDVTSIKIITAVHVFILILLISQYYIGKRRALTAVNARELPDKYSYLSSAADDISSSQGVQKPKLRMGTFGSANAFVVGRKNNGVVVLSETLLTHLPRRTQKTVLAHEISHLKSHDTTLMMLGEGIDSYVEQMKYELMHTMDDNIAAVVLFTPILIILTVCRGIILLPLRFVSRRREYTADADAAEVYKPRVMIAALEHVSRINSHIRDPPRQMAMVDALCIDGVTTSITQRFLGTHPSIDARIENLTQ